MTRPYSVYLHLEVTETLRSLDRSERDRVLRFAHTLAANPFLAGDFREEDHRGRINEVKIVGRSAVVYYVVTQIPKSGFSKFDAWADRLGHIYLGLSLGLHGRDSRHNAGGGPEPRIPKKSRRRSLNEYTELRCTTNSSPKPTS